MYPSEHNEVFERKIQQHEIVKSLRKSVVDLQLQICLTQSPAMIAKGRQRSPGHSLGSYFPI